MSIINRYSFLKPNPSVKVFIKLWLFRFFYGTLKKKAKERFYEDSQNAFSDSFGCGSHCGACAPDRARGADNFRCRRGSDCH